jgi:hypothetical protein
MDETSEPLDWRASRWGIFHLDAQDFDAAVWRERKGRRRSRAARGRLWRARVLHRASGAKLFSEACATVEEAKAAALDLAARMGADRGDAGR